MNVYTIKEMAVPMISNVYKKGHDLNVATRIGLLRAVEDSDKKIVYLSFNKIFLNEN